MKNRKGGGLTAIYNFGVHLACAFFTFSCSCLCIRQANAINDAVKEYGDYGAKMLEKQIDGANSVAIFYTIAFVLCLCGAVCALIHAKKYVSNENRKNVFGFISTIIGIIVSGYLAITVIITITEMNNTSASSLSSALSASLISISFGEFWVWLMLLICIANLGLSIKGLVDVIIAPKNVAAILEAKEDVPTGPMSVVQQFAKPEKKDLPPMLSTDDDAQVNPAISGLRNVMPIGGATSGEQSDAIANNNVPADNGTAIESTPVEGNTPVESAAPVVSATPVVSSNPSIESNTPVVGDIPVADNTSTVNTINNQESVGADQIQGSNGLI